MNKKPVKKRTEEVNDSDSSDSAGRKGRKTCYKTKIIDVSSDEDNSDTTTSLSDDEQTKLQVLFDETKHTKMVINLVWANENELNHSE